MAENPRIEELRRRVQMDPASIAFAALAEEYRRMGRHEEAIETCRAGLQRHPAYLSARVTLGRALIETGDFEGAREELETVLKSAPENLAAIRGLALIHERLGHSAEMDPQFAALMNAEVERIALAAKNAPPPEPPPAAPEAAPPAQEAAPSPPIAPPSSIPVREPIRLSARPAPVIDPPGFAPLPDPEPEPEIRHPEIDIAFDPAPEPGFVPEPVFDAGPDPAMLATIARLERFLAAIDAARHA
jgi:tetratricopeptide (TPR) repeat protein